MFLWITQWNIQTVGKSSHNSQESFHQIMIERELLDLLKGTYTMRALPVKSMAQANAMQKVDLDIIFFEPCK